MVPHLFANLVCYYSDRSTVPATILLKQVGSRKLKIMLDVGKAWFYTPAI
jgi:hypothetical protein